ncbi:acyl-CoA thioesterase [Thiorhodovibrio frisius]|uniref:Acyl-CoA hydrolase n=1 Tax=Thiorhodovibrio frisius TaxID=631362 RepID=H8YXC8_9GAMM|nr:acyl-CoA thioesterase [Thiorhodovibrio frisius]EIC23104.1 acyl-CoA hydrolase [Thiorhodovibrio frisius]WPL22632.1 putative aromatic compound catabolism protein [Thiorhodovibrio frisius]
MESFKVVRPEHLNHYGYLFGGFLLKWVDEISWIAASRDYPGCRLVTVAMDNVEFHCGTRQGMVLRFDASESRRGTTSVAYRVIVFSDDLDTGAEMQIFSTCVTFVRLDAEGKKTPLPGVKAGQD